MPHIIVVFDCSGSMGEPFHSLKRTRKRKYLQHEIKLEAAKSSLMDWLRKSEFDVVTIIPFSSRVERKLTGFLPKNLMRIHNYVYGQIAGGDTNLQAAISRAIKTASSDTEDSYVQYLIVTDGLSHTIEQDIKLIQEIPISHGVSGILIDPTPEGEHHLRQLCVRGSYLPVTGFGELAKSLERQGKAYTERIKLSKNITRLAMKSKEVAEKLSNTGKQINEFPRLQKELEKIAVAATRRTKGVRERERAITHQIADQTFDISQITNDINETEQEQANLDAIVDLLVKYEQLVQKLKISISHPRFLAKGHTTTLFIRVYPIDNQIRDLNREIRKLGAAKRLYNTVLTVGINATIKLESQQIEFSNEFSKKLLKGENILEFTAKPDEQSNPGQHEVTLIIYNKQTAKEYVSLSFELELADFAFRQVSRPLLIRWSAILSSLISIIVIICIPLRLVNLPIGLLLSFIAGIGAIAGLALYMRYFKMHIIVK